MLIFKYLWSWLIRFWYVFCFTFLHFGYENVTASATREQGRACICNNPCITLYQSPRFVSIILLTWINILQQKKDLAMIVSDVPARINARSDWFQIAKRNQSFMKLMKRSQILNIITLHIFIKSSCWTNKSEDIKTMCYTYWYRSKAYNSNLNWLLYI